MPRRIPARGREAGRAASREVILAGGAFNTPQLLMLSGIGDRRGARAARRSRSWSSLPGVGTQPAGSLRGRGRQSHGVRCWKSLRGRHVHARRSAVSASGRRSSDGVYTTNGAIVVGGRCPRARAARARPVLYAVIAKFTGYRPGYSTGAAEQPERPHVGRAQGAHQQHAPARVTLRSAQPVRSAGHQLPLLRGRQRSARRQDLESVVERRQVRRATMATDLKAQGLIDAGGSRPGDGVHVRRRSCRSSCANHAWGHHASCTCPIGDRAHGGVLTSDFKVHGTEGLRVVDASVFPRVPGLFIVSAVYMIGEKAADVIAADARGDRRRDAERRKARSDRWRSSSIRRRSERRALEELAGRDSRDPADADSQQRAADRSRIAAPTSSRSPADGACCKSSA